MPVSNVLLAATAALCVLYLLMPFDRSFFRFRRDRQHQIVDQMHRERMTLFDKLDRRLHRMRAGLNVNHYLVLSMGMGFGSIWLTSLILQSWWLGLPAFFSGILFTERLIHILGARRKERFEEGNVKAIRLMASSLRTSPSYLHAFDQVAVSPYINKQVAEEYTRVVEMLRGQVPIERVMAEFFERTGSADVSYLATIVRIQREMGGDMAKTLDLAASAILRKRQSLRRQRAAMSQILAQVNLLSVMPFVFIVALYANNPHHFDSLTATPGGRFTMLGCLFCILVGGEVIRYLALKGLHKGG
ncbi:type II secretion system F family protein [Brevibacillus sp. H7]|uniref:type II secretion system F family protein n=1 Tax=Brevibacillus sp. H7 TaxID=3349138 RepID=UPI0037F5D8AC